MISILDEKDCCGCGACVDVCPRDCITMAEGSLGAIFPKIETIKCINCHRCEKTCPMYRKTSQSDCQLLSAFKQVAYAAYNKNKSIRMQSSSGGMFSTFSICLLHKEYTVFGAAFDNRLKLRLSSCDNISSLRQLCKSKYLQSDMIGGYRNIERLLKNGKKVMFSGTPCQVVALRKYLDRDYRNLILIDFFCHGVPSQAFFDNCKSLEESRKQIRIIEYEFRSKLNHGGVTPHYYTLKYQKDEKIKQSTKIYYFSKFYAAFQSYINLRESCYDCQFSGQNRDSDITLGDFHEINRYIKNINRFDGVSIVIVNTEKGNQLLKDCAEDITLFPFDLARLITDRQCFCGGTERPVKRDDFLRDFESISFSDLIDKYFSINHYWKQRVYYHCPEIVRKMLKKLGSI